jgi:hypothetical protein
MNGLQKENGLVNLHNVEIVVELLDLQPRQVTYSAWNGRVKDEEATDFGGRNDRRCCSHRLQLVQSQLV